MQCDRVSWSVVRGGAGCGMKCVTRGAWQVGRGYEVWSGRRVGGTRREIKARTDHVCVHMFVRGRWEGTVGCSRAAVLLLRGVG